MANDIQSRKWLLTINNPFDNNFEHDVIKVILKGLPTLLFWCMCDEIGEKGTYHTHVYIALENGMMFSRIKKLFPTAHIDNAKGTSAQNKDYIRKEGKWEKDKKKETNLLDTYEEYGELPIEQQGKRNDLDNLYDMIKQGMSNFEIMENNPAYMLQIDKIERSRQIIKEEKYKNEFRKMDVRYIYGQSGVGKTRGVMELHGYVNIYRVTDYQHPFDNYKGQEYIIFEEFRSSLRIQDMLNYLDGYPLELPSRYINKIACFNKVYIITNLSLEEQYKEVQEKHMDTWKAFLRRINRVIHMKEDLSEIFTIEEYFNRKETEYISLEEYNQAEFPWVV